MIPKVSVIEWMEPLAALFSQLESRILRWGRKAMILLVVNLRETLFGMLPGSDENLTNDHVT